MLPAEEAVALVENVSVVDEPRDPVPELMEEGDAVPVLAEEMALSHQLPVNVLDKPPELDPEL